MSGSARPQAAKARARRKPVDPRTIAGARRSQLPATFKLELATLVTAPPEGSQWVHELKFDGYRMLARIERGKVQLFSRNAKDWTQRMGALVPALERLPVTSAAIDGEVVVLDAEGVSRFEALQEALGRTPRPGATLVFYVFDLLYLDGYDLRAASLVDRKAALAGVLARAGSRSPLRLSEHIVGQGSAFHRQACGAGLEGIISKRADSPYRGARSAAWLKIKCRLSQELVIGGYTDPAGARAGFGALLLGYYERGKLRYAGRVGTGFNERQLEALAQRLRGIEQRASPFVDLRQRKAGVHWVAPRLVAQVEFSNWTNDHLLRQAAFQGLREDKPARDVRRERPRGRPATRSSPAG